MVAEEQFARTRRQLHGIVETLIAGPQYRSESTIRLRVVPGGIGGAKLPVSIQGADLVWESGRTPLQGTVRDLAAIAGIDAGAPQGVYNDVTSWSLDEPLDIDATAAATILDWYRIGDAALRIFAPEQEPILWPEHFDIGIVVDETNYGVSPGDDFENGPYAYVSPWQARTGDFWNAPFGGYRSSQNLTDVDAVVDYFSEGRAELR